MLRSRAGLLFAMDRLSLRDGEWSVPILEHVIEECGYPRFQHPLVPHKTENAGVLVRCSLHGGPVMIAERLSTLRLDHSVRPRIKVKGTITVGTGEVRFAKAYRRLLCCVFQKLCPDVRDRSATALAKAFSFGGMWAC